MGDTESRFSRVHQRLFSDESAVDGLLWALADRQGTVADWVEYDDVSNTTSVYDHVEYDSFGNLISQTNGSHTITLGGYTGRWHDPETNLTNHNDRWTQNGRWLSEDGDGFKAGDINLRRYVGNSPTNATDPTGHIPYIGAYSSVGAPKKRDHQGFPAGIGTWTPREFFWPLSSLESQTRWGCGGVAAWRAGVPLDPKFGVYNPLDIPKMPGTKEYGTEGEAKRALTALGGKGVIIAVQNDNKNWKEAPGSGNFATCFGNYWEYVNHGGPGMLIKHRPKLPTNFKYTTYFVVPRQ